MARAGTLPHGISMLRGRYRTRVSADGIQYSIGVYDTLTDAKAALAIAKSEITRGTFVPPPERRRAVAAERAAEREAAALSVEQSMTLADWVETWLQRMDARPDRSRATVVSYRSLLNTHLLPRLGDVRLVDLRTEDVASLLDEVAAQPSKRHPGQTHNGVTPRLAVVIRSCLKAAVKQKAGGLTAFEFPDTPKAVRVRPEDVDGEVATPAEVERFVAEMPEHLAVAVELAAYCALRLGEVLGLERRDLEHLDSPEQATLHVRRQFNVKANTLTMPKANSVRTVAIPAAIVHRLVDHLDRFVGPDPTSPVMTDGVHLGKRVSQSTLDREWRAARARAGRPRFVFHGLRHTGLTLFAQQGATMAELLERGGHTDVTVALRYQHATAERDRALTARLSSAIRTARQNK